MKYILVLFMMCMSLSCKKDSQTNLLLSAGASNKIEGDIIWGGVTSTHFINHPPVPPNIYAYFSLNSTFQANIPYVINIQGSQSDTNVSFQIANPNLHTPGVYNFQDLDSNHYVGAHLQTGYAYGGTPTPTSYIATSWSNKGRLTIDTISENRISGSIDTYCYAEGIVIDPTDSNEVHLLIHFSGDLRRN